MKWSIIIPKTVLKRELGYSSASELSDADKKALAAATNQAKQTKIGKCGLKKGVVVKVELTTAGGARRMALLSLGDGNSLILLFIRDKGDPIGKNLSDKNAKFTNALESTAEIATQEISNDEVAVVIVEDGKVVEARDATPKQAASPGNPPKAAKKK